MGLQETFAANTAQRAKTLALGTASRQQANNRVIDGYLKAVAIRNETDLRNKQLDLQAEQLKLDQLYKEKNYDLAKDKFKSLEDAAERKYDADRLDAYYKSEQAKREHEERQQGLKDLHELKKLELETEGSMRSLGHQAKIAEENRDKYATDQYAAYQALPDDVKNQPVIMIGLRTIMDSIGTDVSKDFADKLRSDLSNATVSGVRVQLDRTDLDNSKRTQADTENGEINFGDNTGAYQYRTTKEQMADGSVREVLWYSVYNNQPIPEDQRLPVLGRGSMSANDLWKVFQDPSMEAESKRIIGDMADLMGPDVTYEDQVAFIETMKLHLKKTKSLMLGKSDKDYAENPAALMAGVTANWANFERQGLVQDIYNKGMSSITGHPWIKNDPDGLGAGSGGSFPDSAFGDETETETTAPGGGSPVEPSPVAPSSDEPSSPSSEWDHNVKLSDKKNWEKDDEGFIGGMAKITRMISPVPPRTWKNAGEHIPENAGNIFKHYEDQVLEKSYDIDPTLTPKKIKQAQAVIQLQGLEQAFIQYKKLLTDEQSMKYGKGASHTRNIVQLKRELDEVNQVLKVLPTILSKVKSGGWAGSKVGKIKEWNYNSDTEKNESRLIVDEYSVNPEYIANVFKQGESPLFAFHRLYDENQRNLVKNGGDFYDTSQEYRGRIYDPGQTYIPSRARGMNLFGAIPQFDGVSEPRSNPASVRNPNAR
tara:strand:- start:3936 stop:6062 length:2127 start_codon:yes stop_codon:yes gene_type:complete